MVSLTGCVRSPEVIKIPVDRIVIEKVRVPVDLLAECRRPDMDSLVSTGDLERVAAEAIVSLDKCNADKASIRDWQERE